MANKVHPRLLPHASASSSSSSSSVVSVNPFTSSKKETFTIWMKSLIFSSKGCTVFDSSGRIVYRVDNYNCKNSHEVYLMDLTGKALFTIRRKKLKLFRLWEGYRSYDDERAAFQVREKSLRILGRDSACEVIVWSDKDQPCRYYQMESCAGHSSAFKIVDKLGGLLAEVKRKQSKCGISLGEDVLLMVVEPHTDHSLIMALLVVYALINCTM